MCQLSFSIMIHHMMHPSSKLHYCSGMASQQYPLPQAQGVIPFPMNPRSLVSAHSYHGSPSSIMQPLAYTACAPTMLPLPSMFCQATQSHTATLASPYTKMSLCPTTAAVPFESRVVSAESQLVANHFQQSNPALQAQTRNAEIIAYIRWRLQLESQQSSVPLNESLKALQRSPVHAGLFGGCEEAEIGRHEEGHCAGNP